MAKFIHVYTEDTILVICYTNHALDQFLQDLIDIGIPASDVVRLGGKGSPQTAHMSLRNQSVVSQMSRADWTVVDQCKSDSEAHIRSLETAFRHYQSFSPRHDDIMAHIEFADPDFFEALTVPEDEDGMARVGKGGKAVDESYLLKQWSTGKNAGIFKNHPQIKRNTDVWSMPASSREARLARWRNDLLELHIQDISSNGRLLNRRQTELQQKFEEKDVAILRSKRIIGCTTTAAAKYKETIQAAAPNVLLVEEAGEILESHVITALGLDSRQMILIGDHKFVFLPPLTSPS